MPIAQKKTPADFIEKEVLDDLMDDDVFEDETEDVVSATNHAIQSGWDAALKAMEPTRDRKYFKDFRFEEEPQLVKFLDPAPFAVFLQHWVQRPGRKSFVSPVGLDPNTDLSADPLYEYIVRCNDQGRPTEQGKPSKKIALSIVNFSLEEPTQQTLVVTASTAGQQLARLNEDPKTGPLDRLFWSLSKTGSGTSTGYNMVPVKQRDMLEDWGIDPEWAESIQETFTAQTADSIRPATYDELLEVLEEVKDKDAARNR